MLLRVRGTLDSAAHQQQILIPALSFAKGTRTTRGQVFIQQENASPHVSHSTQHFLAQKHVQLLPDWPPNSPDLNIVENVWAIRANKTTEKNISDRKMSVGRESKLLGLLCQFPLYINCDNPSPSTYQDGQGKLYKGKPFGQFHCSVVCAIL